MNNQLVELQTQIAFQEDTLQSLNDVVANQQKQIDALKQEVNFIKQQFSELVAGMGENSPEEKPPHY